MKNNNKGLSLIETLVALGISATAAVAWMNHMQNVSRDETRTRIRSAIATLSSQANDYLKNSSFCNANVGDAFKNVELTGTQINGRANYSVLKNTGYVDGGGNLIQTDVFKKGDLYENDKVMVSNVTYEVTNLTKINVTGSPWTHSGNLKVGVEFSYCRNYGAFARKNSNNTVTTICPSNMIIKAVKSYERIANFKTDANGFITNSPIKVEYIDPNTGLPATKTTGTQYDLTCDSIASTAVDPDYQGCLAEANIMMRIGLAGVTDCGIKVVVTESSRTFTSYSSSTTFTTPSDMVTNSLEAELFGAGGGGAGNSKDSGCRGGKAGAYNKVTLTSQPGESCVVTVGTPGVNNKGISNDRRMHGGLGGDSKVKCTSSSQVVALGGLGGGYETRTTFGDACIGGTNCGTAGENFILPDGTTFSYGGGSGCKKDSGKPGGIGAGGGGGGEDRDGAAGGRGQVTLRWKVAKRYNSSGVLIDSKGNPI